MSSESKLNDLLQRLNKNSQKLDETSKNIANATTRVTYALAKGQQFRDKYNVPLEKYEQVINFTQKCVDICSNYVGPDILNRNIDSENGNAGAEALEFERFEAKVINQLDKNEAEIVKLQSLRDVINQVMDQ